MSPDNIPDLPHLDCPVGNQWSWFRWSKEDEGATSCQCGGCGNWQSVDAAWKQIENDRTKGNE